MSRMRRHVVLAGAAAVVAGAAAAVVVATGGAATRPVSAVFAQAPALYPGNQVQVLGMPVGTVTAVQPGPGGVVVGMAVDRSVPLPADAQAYLVAPEVVNDRSVALSAYRGGPTLAPGARIPEGRTHAPLPVDQVLSNLDNVFQALGPAAGASHGVISALVSALNRDLGGLGPAINATITSLGSATGGLGADALPLAGTLGKLRPFVTAAAQDSRNYETFSTDLADVSTALNGQRGALAGALSDLQQTLGQLAGFIHANQQTLGATLDHLDTVASQAAAREQDLAHILQVAPLALQNLSNAIVTTPTATQPHVPYLQTRVDFINNTQRLTNQECGNGVAGRGLRVVNVLLGDATQRTLGVNTASSLGVPCFFGTAAQNFGVAEGSPTIDLNLADLMAAGGR